MGRLDRLRKKRGSFQIHALKLKHVSLHSNWKRFPPLPYWQYGNMAKLCGLKTSVSLGQPELVILAFFTTCLLSPFYKVLFAQGLQARKKYKIIRQPIGKHAYPHNSVQ
jgi:hypothetical protein